MTGRKNADYLLLEQMLPDIKQVILVIRNVKLHSYCLQSSEVIDFRVCGSFNSVFCL